MLTGATGFVGGEVLAELVAHPDVAVVTCLVRRPLTEVPSATGVVVETVIVEDFAHWDPSLIARLAGHDACVWTLGAKDSDVADPARYERITHTFTLAFATAIAAARKAARTTGTFTFCYLSGAGADPTETARLPWQRRTRHLKGRTERDLRALAGPAFPVHCFRPAGILPRATGRLVRTILAPISVGVDVLARALVDVAVRPGADSPDVVSNAAIKRRTARR